MSARPRPPSVPVIRLKLRPTLVVSGLALLLVIFGLHAWLQAQMSPAALEKRLAGLTGLDVRCGDVRLGWTGDVSLTDVHVANDGVELFSADQARVQVSLLGLLRGRVDLLSFVLESPRIVVRAADAAALGKKLVRQTGTTPERFSMRVHDGSLSYKGGIAGVELTRVTGTLKVLDARIQFDGRADFTVSPGSVSAPLESTKNFAAQDIGRPLSPMVAGAWTGSLQMAGALTDPIVDVDGDIQPGRIGPATFEKAHVTGVQSRTASIDVSSASYGGQSVGAVSVRLERTGSRVDIDARAPAVRGTIDVVLGVGSGPVDFNLTQVGLYDWKLPTVEGQILPGYPIVRVVRFELPSVHVLKKIIDFNN